MPKVKPTKSEKLGSAFKSLDLFGQGIGFTISGNDTHQTLCGAILSLMAIIVTVSYAQDRFKTMWAFGDTTYQETKQDVAYTAYQPYQFGTNGENFAFFVEKGDNFESVE